MTKNVPGNGLVILFIFLLMAVLFCLSSLCAAEIDVKIAHGTFATPAGAGIDSIDTVGFQPKAIVLYGVPVKDENINADSCFWIGMTDGTDQYVTKTSGQDAASNTQRQQDVTRVISILVGNNHTAMVEATLDSFDSAGFNLNYSTASAGYVVNYIAFGGADLSADLSMAIATAGAVTGLSFSPDLVFTMSIGLANITSSQTHGIHGFGVFGSDLDQWWLASTQAQDAVTIKDSVLVSNGFIGQFWNGSITWYCTATAINADGFSFSRTGADGGDYFFYLALDFGGLGTNVGVFTKETSGSKGIEQSLAELGFTPQIMGFGSAGEIDEVGTTVNNSKLTYGVTDGNTQMSFTRTDIDNASSAKQRQNNDHVLGISLTDSNYVAAARIEHLNDPTPGLTWDPNNTTAYRIGYWAVEEVPAPTKLSDVSLRGAELR